MSPRTPRCPPKSRITPPPRSHPRSLLLLVIMLLVVKSICDLIRPRPPSTYGCTGPMAGTTMRLLISVRTLDESSGALPKKSLAYANSSSKPRMLPIDPSATPAFNFLSWQLVMFGQPASPPKSYPMNGLMKPCARTSLARAKVSARATTPVATVLPAQCLSTIPPCSSFIHEPTVREPFRRRFRF